MPDPQIPKRFSYISHARTPEELKVEVCSDLNRRIAHLADYSLIIAKSAAEKARLATGIRELETMLDYWQALEIVKSPKRRNFNSTKGSTVGAVTE